MKNILFYILVALLLLFSTPLAAFEVYIFADMEGCSGITDRAHTTGTLGPQMMAEDINACVAACFEAGATVVTVKDGHGKGINVNPDLIDSRAKLVQGATPGVRFYGMTKSCEAVILLGYHAMSLTPNAILAHSYSSATIQNIYLNGKRVGEIGLDAIIAGEHGVPVVMVSGDNKSCLEAKEWIDGVVVCPVKEATSHLSGRCLPIEKSHKLIVKKTKQALAKRQKIAVTTTSLPAVLRYEYLPKDYGRVYMPDFVECNNPRIVERSGDIIESLMLGKRK